jgi:hypothetical protein
MKLGYFMGALVAQLRLVLNCFIASGLDTQRTEGEVGVEWSVFIVTAAREAILCAAAGMITGKFNYQKTSKLRSLERV